MGSTRTPPARPAQNVRRSALAASEPPPRTSMWKALRAWIARVRQERAQAAAASKPGPADAVLAATVLALMSFGVVMVYSASAVFAYGRYDDGQHFLVRQGVFALVGLVIVIAFAHFDYHRIRPLTYLALLGSVGLLLFTSLGGGKRAGGASRWIEIGAIHVQPAEVAKLAMIFWLAYSLSNKSQRMRTFSVGFLPHLLVALVLMALCYEQPDFGSAVMIGLMTFVLLFAAGARVAYMLLAGAAALPILYYAITGAEYRMRRIKAFLSPFEYRYDDGYQISESLMSFGAGGLHGVGIGDSRQKLFFLPEAHTDFIAAIIGEELGFVGVCAVVAAFLLLLQRGLRASFRAADDYGTYLALGITMFIALQAFTNLAVALGLVPTKGLVLPFVSYGGSALLVNCAAVGILLNVSRPRKGTAEFTSNERAGLYNARTAESGGVA